MSGICNGIGPFGGQLCPDYEQHEAPKIVHFVRFRTWPLPLLSWVLLSYPSLYTYWGSPQICGPRHALNTMSLQLRVVITSIHLDRSLLLPVLRRSTHLRGSQRTQGHNAAALDLSS